MDLGRAGVVELPQEETERRWQTTTPQWPIMHAVTYGVSRDQMMARHKATTSRSPTRPTPPPPTGPSQPRQPVSPHLASK